MTPGRRLAPAALLALMMSPGSLVSPVSAAEPAGVLRVETDEPRAFGYQVGDLVSRSVTIDVPGALVLDETSVPRPGAFGKALELRRASLQRSDEVDAQRQRVQRLRLRLDYQVFLSPPAVRTLEMPAFRLRFEGRPRDQEVRVEAWPVTVSPLVPVEVSPRRGLGDLQPDQPPLLIDTGAGRGRLLAYAAVALLLLAYLGHVHLLAPWWMRRRRPFAAAWHELRGLSRHAAEPQWRAALQRMHAALNEAAGEVVFEHSLGRLLAAQPRLAPLQGELRAFFGRSRRTFFGAEAGEVGETPDSAWLIALCRKCRDVEREAAA